MKEKKINYEIPQLTLGNNVIYDLLDDSHEPAQPSTSIVGVNPKIKTKEIKKTKDKTMKEKKVEGIDKIFEGDPLGLLSICI